MKKTFKKILRFVLPFVAILIMLSGVIAGAGVGESGATGVTGATGCTGPYRGCTYTGGSPTTTTIPAPSGPQCHYSIAADYSSFALKCTDLYSYFHYLYEIQGGLCVGGLTCSNVMGINTGSYHNLTDQGVGGNNLPLGGPSTVFYLDSSNALKCGLTQTRSSCAAAGNSLIPGWTDPDTYPGCTAGATEINSFYWLFPPGVGSMGDLCVDAMHPSTPQTSSSIGVRGASSLTTQTFVALNNGGAGPTMIYDGTNGYVTTPELGPCVINTFHGPKTIDSPQDAIYNAVMSPGSHTLLAVPASSPNFATIPPSWVNYSDVLGEAVSGFASSVASVGTSTLDINMSQAGSFSSIELFCSDSSGAWYDLGNISTIVGSETAPTLPGSSSDCYSTLSFGWNPGVDVISGFKALGCVVQTLFVPPSSSVTALANEFGVGGSSVCSSGGSVAVTQWVGCVGQAVVSVPSSTVTAIQAAADGGTCSGAAAVGPTVAGVHVTTCSLLVDATPTATVYGGGAGGVLASLRDVLAAIVYTFAAWGLIHLLRRILAGNS